ncbi:chromosome partition protein MukE [Roseateles paludis]|jgi:chromosome condensin MukBEF MukE localization factor|uniref:Chromosome partition protein MukE n=1 Tax=Roseateles paludis TaxID=3145238 RepID=A0ABV0FYC3_9BURK
MNTIDPRFAAVDVLLRSGGQVNRSDFADYEYLSTQLDELQRFYAGYQATLVQHPDGFFFLQAQDGLIPTRRLPRSTMHMGQFVCSKCRDPEITRTSGVLSVRQIVQELESALTKTELLRIYAPRHGRTVAPARAHEQMQKSLRELARLRFVRIKGDALTPAESIHRFAELARHGNEPDELGALSLQGRGVVLDPDELDEAGEEAGDGEGEGDDEAEAE